MRVVLDNGTSIELGETEATPTIGITDYSRRVTDDYGVTTVVPRGFSRRMSVKLALPFNRVSAVQQQLADLRATSPLWVADDSLAWLSVRGFYKDFDLDHAVPPLSYCTLTIEGLAETSTAVDDGRDPAPIGATSTLQLLQPGTVDDRVLASSSVAENDYPEWSATTVYPVAARVIRASTHRIYESVSAGNAGNDPAGVSGKWLDVGPTNRWAMFDQALGSVSTAANAITVALDVTGVDALALLDVIGATVRVQAPGYDRTLANTGGAITFAGLPTAAVRVTVTISGSGQVSVGTLLAGCMLNLGITEASPTAGITDYSRKVVDDFGEVTVVQRAWAKRMSARALIRTDAVDAVANRIAAVRALPSLWVGQTGLDSLTVYGFFKDFSIEVGTNVSKLSLSIEGLSKAPPPAALPTPPIIAWPDIVDPIGTKPTDNADVTGENTSKDTAAVGGKPVAEVLATLDKIVPIENRFEPIESDISALEEAKVGTDASLVALTRATVDQDAVLRQIERDAGRLDETLLRLLSESTRTRAVLRDAGIIVDPATGIVRIYAVDQLADRTSRAEIALDGVSATITQKASVDYVNEQIALAVLDPSQAAQLEPILYRLTSAEQTIDGLNAVVALKAEAIELTRVSGTVTTVRQDLDALVGTVSTKAEKTVVDALGIAVGSVEQTLSTLGNVSGISVTIRQARAVADDAATATLRGLLASDGADRRRIIAQSEIRQELYTKIVDDVTAEAVARTLLSVKIGDLDARSVQETTLRIAVDKVLGERIDSLSIVAGDQAAAIATLTQASIGAGIGIAGIQTTIRQQSRDDDQSAEALLGSLIAGDQAGQRRASQLVQIQTEFTTTLVANEAASAVARQVLLARMGLAEAAIITTSKVLADTTQALTSRIEAAEAAFNDASTGLAATRAQLVREEGLRAAGDEANAYDITVLDAELNHPTTGLPATRATVATNRQAQVDGDSANARSIEQLSGQVFDPATGLPAANARIDLEREASVQRDNANAIDTSLLAVELHDPATGLVATRATVASDRQASVDRDNANARSVEQVSVRLDGVGGVGVEQAISATVDRLGKIEGRYTVTVDANGNVSGFQLIGSDAGPGSLNLINTDLRMGTGRVIFNNGSFMQVQGVAFGAQGDLLEWFGPTMALAQCTRANATAYKTINGSAYFGGSLSAGTIKNAVQTTNAGGPGVSVSTGKVGSNGRSRSIVASYAWSRESQMATAANGGAASGGITAQVKLYRNGTEIGTLDATGEWRRTAYAGSGSPATYSEAIGGSLTINDLTGGNQVEYSAILIIRTLGPGPGSTAIVSDSIGQNISIVETEE